MTPGPARSLRCSFCRRKPEDVRAMAVGASRIAGFRPAICWDCCAESVVVMCKLRPDTAAEPETAQSPAREGAAQ